ncbi:MAG: cytochrome c3 family protein [bacterium]
MKIFSYSLSSLHAMKTLTVSFCLLLITSKVSAINGPHARNRANNRKGICANCHTPHGAKATKLWNLEVPTGTFGGVRLLCYSCHNPDSDAYKEMAPGRPVLGIEDVFDPEHRFEDHVMHGGAVYGDPVATSLRPDVDIGGGHFPVDPRDWDTVPDMRKGTIHQRRAFDRIHWSTGNYRKGNSRQGMYCGTCHNPHYDPGYGETHDPSRGTQGGAYLRPGKSGGVGSWDTNYENSKRKEFCIKCHLLWHFENRDDCFDCHHPHRGANLLMETQNEDRNYFIEIAGRSILIHPFPDWPPPDPEKIVGFRALPNVPRIRDNAVKDRPQILSFICYSCHGPKGAETWGKKGATTIHGDDSTTPREHHPMGLSAIWKRIPRAPGIDELIKAGAKDILTYGIKDPENPIDEGSQLSCPSCHETQHNLMSPAGNLSSRKNNYLRWDFANDNPLFCCQCHTNKHPDRLGAMKTGHRQTRQSAAERGVTRIVHEFENVENPSVPVEIGCGNCMFCHFIHDGQYPDGTQRGDMLTPDLDALMRVPPLNLAWADKWADQDRFDFEDMCFGCHGNSRIVGGPGISGSLLLPPNGPAPSGQTIPGGPRFSHRFAAPPMSETTAANIQWGGKFPLSDGWAKPPTEGVTVERNLDDYGVSPGLIYCGTCHNVHDNRTNPGSPYLRGTRSPYVPMGFCEECHTTPMSTMFIDPLLNHPLGRGPAPTTSITWLPEFVTGLSGEKGGVTFTPGGGPPEIGMVICLTCHNVHAASTTYDGWADYPHSLGSVSAPGNRGNLLVVDNYRDPSGSDMCIRCHPDFSRIVNSPHDFSPGYRPGCQIGQKGACSACHVPHNAASAVTWNNKPVLWARSLAAEESCFQQHINPAYTLGDTLLCYDCHSRCNDDPPLIAYGEFIPQDVAFVDGPGGESIGYYEVAPLWLQDIPPRGFKTGGHYIKSPSPGGIMTGDKLACSECHDPHRGWTRNKNQNQAFIKEWLGGRRNEGFFASRNMAYHPQIRNNTESRLICINCHGFSYDPSSGLPPTSVPFAAVNPSWANPMPITSPTPTVFEHSSLGVFACTDCHRHAQITVFCIDCHAFPPTSIGNLWSGPGDTDENYPGGAGAHAVHVFNCKYDCLTCHVGCLHNAGGATVVNPRFDRSKVSVDFNPLFGFPRLVGEYPTKMGYPGLPPLYNPLEQVCFVGCHNPLVGDPDEPPNLNNPTPSWSLALKNLPIPPTYPSPPLPGWMPDPRVDSFYKQLLTAPAGLPPVNPPPVPWPLPAIP